ncbi:MAG: zinc dependent phospholipase C family protein [Microscillaceae bacterium]|jgi:hypothetical protein|nr:zinc dependent phospholipase C family protein [Microscillaceae bacterium]
MKHLIIITLIINLFCSSQAEAWGFFAHQRINRLAVFTLPPEMLGFYKYYIRYITENAVNPDKRRYAVVGEAPRHYIDIDVYDRIFKDSAVYKMPRYWQQAVQMFGEDSLQAYGIVPWHIQRMKFQLTEAFKTKNLSQILRVSTDLGHYIGDANVPLHTTENYNGQLSNQVGIHGFWESRLPELFIDTYDFFVARAQYLPNTQLKAWEAVINAHLALDSVLRFEKELSQKFSEDKKYAFEERNRLIMRTYSRDFASAYHRLLNGQVERRMKAAIKMLGDFWFTCWVDAGQPDLDDLLQPDVLQKENDSLELEKKQWLEPKLPARIEGDAQLLRHPQDCCGSNRYLAYYRRKIKN